MKIDGGMRGGLDHAAADAARQEERGYDGVRMAETSHDPFLPLMLAAQAPSGSTSAPPSPSRSPATP